MNLLRRRVRRHGPLRVLFVVPDLVVGGAERHVVTLAPALDPARFAASVVCIGEQGGLFGDLAGTGVPVTALDRRGNRVAALIGLIGHLLRVRPDVVVTRGYNAETLGRIAAVLTRVPRSVVWVHNCGDITPRSRVRRLVDRLLEPVTSAYYGVAEGQRSYLRDGLGHPDHKIEIIHNGVDADRIRPRPAARDHALAAELGLPPDAPVVGIVAMLRPEKDHQTLLRAFRIVVDELPAARLLVVGEGPQRARLEALTAELGLTGSVVFAGSRSDVSAVLGLVDVITLSSYLECFPMALLEAMAAGLPAVGTDVGGVPELIEDGVTGHVVPARDPQALAAALAKLLANPDRAAAMGRAGLDRVRELFTLQRSIQVASQTLERTAGRAPAGSAPRPVRLTFLTDTMDGVGGAELLLLNVFRRLDPGRVRPRVLCLRAEGSLAGELRAAGVHVDVLERRDRYQLTTVPRLARWLRANGTDVVLVNHYDRAALTLGRAAARLAGIPNMVAAHDMDLTSVGGRVLPRHDVETLFLSDALVLLSAGQGRYLHEQEDVGSRPWRSAPEVVIPNGIEIGPPPGPAERSAARAELGLHPDDVAVGVVARLSRQKSHGTLLRAVAAVAPERPRLRLVVIGDGEQRDALVALAAELGITDRVLFTGIRRDVGALLPGLDVSCLSSVHEGVPLAVLESMAAGLPMVATACGALPELVRDGADGFVVPVGDVGALAARLAELVDDPALRAAMGERARARAERDFTLDRTVQGYQRLVEELAKR